MQLLTTEMQWQWATWAWKRKLRQWQAEHGMMQLSWT